MSTQINVTVGSGGLSDKAKQLQAAARQAQLEKERTAQIEADGTEQRNARLAANGQAPDGSALYGVASQLPVIERRPAAFRPGGAFLQFLPPATELATSPYTEPQYLDDINNLGLLDKWWAVKTGGTTTPLAVGEPEEETAPDIRRTYAVLTEDKYFAADLEALVEILPAQFLNRAWVRSFFRTPYFILTKPKRRSLKFSFTLIAGEGQVVGFTNGFRSGDSFTIASAGLGGKKADLSALGMSVSIDFFEDESIQEVKNRLVIRIGTIIPNMIIPIEQGSVNTITIKMRTPDLLVFTHNESVTEMQDDAVQDYLDCVQWTTSGSVEAYRDRTAAIVGGTEASFAPAPTASAKVGRISVEWDR